MTYSEIEDLLFCDETSELVLDGDYYTDYLCYPFQRYL